MLQFPGLARGAPGTPGVRAFRSSGVLAGPPDPLPERIVPALRPRPGRNSSCPLYLLHRWRRPEARCSQYLSQSPALRLSPARPS